MDRSQLLTAMQQLLRSAVDHEGQYNEIDLSADSPLVGNEAVLSSMGLVSYIVDVESAVAEQFDAEVTLVSEQALSRRHSPFRTVNTLADYVIELLTETPAGDGDRASGVAVSGGH